jgi:erythromycin esterase
VDAGDALPRRGSHSRSTPSGLLIVPVALALCAFLTIVACGDGPSAPVERKPLPEPKDPTVWTDWLLSNGHALTSLSPVTFTDLQFLKPLLGDRRIVQLGESGHGVAEFNRAKVRLIQFLHQEAGFNVIAFESDLWACFRADGLATTLSALDFMYSCPYGVWATTEVLRLFEYIQSTRDKDRPLILAGFDMKPSTWRARDSRPEFMANVVAELDQSYAQDVLALERWLASLWSHQAWRDSVAAHANELRAEYEPLLDFFDSHETELLGIFSEEAATPLVARQMAWTALNMIQYTEDRLLGGCAAGETRDKGMAENLTFLARKLFPDKKIMVWAHNYHIRHANRQIPSQGCFTMGEDIESRHRQELYTVGLYMYEGRAAWNTREEYVIARADPNSLEGILHQAGKPYFFLDLLHQTSQDTPAWITGRISARSWGTYEMSLVPQVQYDAVLYIEQVNPPSYTY